MLPKNRRLPIQEALLKKGETLSRGTSFLFKRFTQGEKLPRFGALVGKKVHKSAAERNRIRRIIIAFLKQRHNQLPKGDFLIVALSPAHKLTRVQIVGELEILLQKASHKK